MNRITKRFLHTVLFCVVLMGITFADDYTFNPLLPIGLDNKGAGTGTLDGVYLKKDGSNADTTIDIGSQNFTTTGNVTSGRFSTHIKLRPQTVKLPSSNFALIDAGEDTWRLLFDDTTSESGVWIVPLQGYAGGTLKCDISYTMTSASSGNVIWEVSISAHTEGDATSDSYDTANSVTDDVPGTVGLLGQVSFVLGNVDSVAADDYVKIKIARAAADTASGDAELLELVIRE